MSSILQSASRTVDDPAYQVSLPPLVPRPNRSPLGWSLCRCPEEPDNPREGVHRFTAEVMRPVGERLDKLSCGAGIRRDRPIEKIFRDARLSMIEDGCKRDPGHQG